MTTAIAPHQRLRRDTVLIRLHRGMMKNLYAHGQELAALAREAFAQR